MLIKIKLIVLILTTLMLSISNSTQVNAQSSEFILMPYSYEITSDTIVKEGRDDYGVHKDKIGIGMDYYTDKSTMTIAPVSGLVSFGCSSKGVISVAITRSNGQILRLIHLLKDTLKVREGWVEQGSPIAMTAPKGDYNSEGCNLSSDGYHVHLSIGTPNPNTCLYNIDGYEVNCSGMRECEFEQANKYKLSFKVECNRKYLNQYFDSTNGLKNKGKDCENSILNFNSSINSTIELQACLKKLGFYNKYYSNSLDEYTINQRKLFTSDYNNRKEEEKKLKNISPKTETNQDKKPDSNTNSNNNSNPDSSTEDKPNTNNQTIDNNIKNKTETLSSNQVENVSISNVLYFSLIGILGGGLSYYLLMRKK